MNMQQILMQAQQMKRKMEKAMDELHKKEFNIEKAGIVKVTMLGDKSIVKIEIDEDAMDKENKEMVEETVKMAINELNEQISKEEEEINKSITGSAGGFGF